jgi:hypothetical protein
MKPVALRSFKRLGRTRRELEAPQRRARELALYLSILFLIAAPTALAVFYPKITLAALGASVLFCAIAAVRYQRWRSPLPPPTPLRCPACASEELEILSCGLWHGRDVQGHGTGGGFDYATCRKCGSRCAQYVDGQPYVPTEEEWKQHFDPMEKRRDTARQWPFIPEQPAV